MVKAGMLVAETNIVICKNQGNSIAAPSGRVKEDSRYVENGRNACKDSINWSCFQKEEDISEALKEKLHLENRCHRDEKLGWQPCR